MKSLSSKNPFLKAGGGTPDIDFIHLLLLGGTGVGKSTETSQSNFHLSDQSGN